MVAAKLRRAQKWKAILVAREDSRAIWRRPLYAAAGAVAVMM